MMEVTMTEVTMTEVTMEGAAHIQEIHPMVIVRSMGTKLLTTAMMATICGTEIRTFTAVMEVGVAGNRNAEESVRLSSYLDFI